MRAEVVHVTPSDHQGNAKWHWRFLRPVEERTSVGNRCKYAMKRKLSALKGLRVLVVEDSWHVARELKSVLEQMGMDVAKPAAILADAERLIAENSFDLAVMDINLKGEMTYDLIDRLHDRGVRVVVVTGYPELSGSIGKASAILQKPVRGNELLETLGTVMRGPPQA
jgi:DNA-binding response OmpR family regulator